MSREFFYRRFIRSSTYLRSPDKSIFPMNVSTYPMSPDKSKFPANMSTYPTTPGKSTFSRIRQLIRYPLLFTLIRCYLHSARL